MRDDDLAVCRIGRAACKFARYVFVGQPVEPAALDALIMQSARNGEASDDFTVAAVKGCVKGGSLGELGRRCWIARTRRMLCG